MRTIPKTLNLVYVAPFTLGTVLDEVAVSVVDRLPDLLTLVAVSLACLLSIISLS